MTLSGVLEPQPKNKTGLVLIMTMRLYGIIDECQIVNTIFISRYSLVWCIHFCSCYPKDWRMKMRSIKGEELCD